MEPGKVMKPMHGAVPMLELVVAQRRREEFERAAEMRLIKDAQALRQRVGLSLVRTGSRMIANDDHAEAA